MYFINKSSPSKSVSLLNKNKESLVNSKTKKIKLDKKGKKAGRPSFFRLFLVGGALSVSVALSLRFAKPAHAASSTPPVNKVVSSSNLTSSATGRLGSNKSSSNISLNKEMSFKESRSLKTIQTEDKSSKFRSSQSVGFGTPLALVKNPQMARRSVKTPGEAQSSLGDLLGIDLKKKTDDLTKSNVHEKLLEYNITMNNSTSEITNPTIRYIIVDSARDLANCKLSSVKEVAHLFRAMFRLRIHQIDSLGSNCDTDKLDIFRQKAYGFQFLLKADLKNSDSYTNQVTQNVQNVTREVKDKVEASFPTDFQNQQYKNQQYKKWSPSFKTDFNRAFQKLKLREAQVLESFSDEFLFDQSCDLPLKVYKEFPKYFDEQYFKMFQLFNQYWTYRNHPDSMSFRFILDPKEKEQDLYRPPSSLIEAASIDAVHVMKRGSLIHWYNNKNKANYKVDYQKQTGREPNLFDNWIEGMNIGSLQYENMSSEIFSDDDDGYL